MLVNLSARLTKKDLLLINQEMSPVTELVINVANL